jgi:hypothetical protein
MKKSTNSVKSAKKSSRKESRNVNEDILTHVQIIDEMNKNIQKKNVENGCNLSNISNIGSEIIDKLLNKETEIIEKSGNINDNILTKEQKASILECDILTKEQRNQLLADATIRHDQIVKELDQHIKTANSISKQSWKEIDAINNGEDQWKLQHEPITIPGDEKESEKPLFEFSKLLSPDYQKQVFNKWKNFIAEVMTGFNLNFTVEEQQTLAYILENVNGCSKNAMMSSLESTHPSIQDKYKFILTVNIIAFYHLKSRKFMSIQPMLGPVGFAFNLEGQKIVEKVDENQISMEEFLIRCERTFRLFPWKFEKEYGISDCTDGKFKEKMMEIYHKKYQKAMPLCKIKFERHVTEAKSFKFTIPEPYNLLVTDTDSYSYSHDNAVIKGMIMARKLDDMLLSVMFRDIRSGLMTHGIQPFFHEFKLELDGKKKRVFASNGFEMTELLGTFGNTDNVKNDIQEEAEKLKTIIAEAKLQIAENSHLVTGNYILANSMFREYFETLTASAKGADINFMGMPVHFLDTLPYLNSPNNMNILIGYHDDKLNVRNAVIFSPYIFIDYKESINVDLQKVSLDEIFMNDLDVEPQKMWRTRFGYAKSDNIHNFFRMIEFNPKCFQASFKNLCDTLHEC